MLCASQLRLLRRTAALASAHTASPSRRVAAASKARQKRSTKHRPSATAKAAEWPKTEACASRVPGNGGGSSACDASTEPTARANRGAAAAMRWRGGKHCWVPAPSAASSTMQPCAADSEASSRLSVSERAPPTALPSNEPKAVTALLPSAAVHSGALSASATHSVVSAEVAQSPLPGSQDGRAGTLRGEASGEKELHCAPACGVAVGG